MEEQVILSHIKEKDLIGLNLSGYQWDDTQYGIVMECTDHSLLFQFLSDDYGVPIKKEWVEFSQILGVIKNDQYSKYLETNRMSFQNQQHEVIHDANKITTKQLDLFKKGDFYLCMADNNDDILCEGFLVGYDSQYYFMMNCDRLERHDGYCVVGKKSVSKIYSRLLKNRLMGIKPFADLVSCLYSLDKNHEIVSFEVINHEKSFVAYIKQLTDESITIQELDDYGADIGVSEFMIEDIERYFYRTRTVSNIEEFRQSSQEIKYNSSQTIWKYGKQLLPYILRDIEQSIVVTIFVKNDWGYTGHVKSVDENWLMMDNYDDEGEFDGQMMFQTKLLTGYSKGGLIEQGLDFLIKFHEK